MPAPLILSNLYPSINIPSQPFIFSFHHFITIIIIFTSHYHFFISLYHFFTNIIVSLPVIICFHHSLTILHHSLPMFSPINIYSSFTNISLHFFSFTIITSSFIYRIYFVWLYCSALGRCATPKSHLKQQIFVHWCKR